MGVAAAPVHDVVAGVADAPGPADVRVVADAVLSGVYTGELDVALERAAAFCRVLATGAAFDADHLDDVDPGGAVRLTRGAASLVRTARSSSTPHSCGGRVGWSDVRLAGDRVRVNPQVARRTRTFGAGGPPSRPGCGRTMSGDVGPR